MTPAKRQPGHRTVLVAVLVLLVPAQVFVGLGRRSGGEDALRPASIGAAPLQPERALVPTARPDRRPPSPDPVPLARPPADPSVAAYAGFGVWVDLFDYEDIDPAVWIPELAARGVDTIYVQSGRYNTDSQVHPATAAWLIAGHDAGMDVVAWYLPGYRQMNKDVKRTLAAVNFEVDGHRFDSVGVDIELKELVPDPVEWNARVVEHLRRVRAELPDGYPLSSIVPPPLQMDVAPIRWAGFPWRGIGDNSDVIMLMSYWSYRDCENIQDHCPYEFTHKNIELTRDLTGHPEVPVHTIGGVGDRITVGEVADFVRGAFDGDAYGASLYDLRTTDASYWEHLERLKLLS